ncbi:GNAT family N-acetyltransferase [Pararhodospirillum oryzae]|uniref:N-acetyltransferase GCN5 n=1 Tax=Pararhodospirillum oryzae TaxID=478448 RepID=A0A512HBD0_9PROT|nr:GNAT family N-acetyltransferase [Pararhodospirillum oryzae]GEO82745.1 N-acetyltransferase GCN5 [Pararhodospirillum oryzae]
MNESITVRDAQEADARTIARYMIQAGEGLYEFLLADLVADMSAKSLLTHLVETGEGPLGWPSCRLALKDGQVVGMVNAFPVERFDEMALDMIPADRLAHLAPLFQARVEGSLRLNAMAVDPAQRGAGIGMRLIAEAVGMAGAQKRKTVSLLVWSTNLRAIKLYEDFGFQHAGMIALPAHPRLSARRAQIMTRAV